MAYMIPNKPREYDEYSNEGEIFQKLNDALPKEYVVIHSSKLFYYDKVKKEISYNKKNNKLIEQEREIDFIIFHPEKGILCLEVKNTIPKYKDGIWYYSNDIPMGHYGPYNQAESVKNCLHNLLKKYFPEINCKVTFGVWFYKMPKVAMEQENWPKMDAPKERTLTKESVDIIQLKKDIDKIFDIEFINYSMKNPLSPDETKIILQFLKPRFEYVPSTFEINKENEIKLNELLEQQKRILWFLDEQQNAVIHGIGGTGKTMIAIERAKECASNNESVLFLCYNSKLADFLNSTHSFPKVTYFTVDKFVTNDCRTTIDDTKRFEKFFDKYSDEESRKNLYKRYNHIIIDEGQDFNDIIYTEEQTKELGPCCVAEILSLAMKENGGTFFFFYDKHQLLYNQDLSSFVDKADCKLSLYVNCRNTKWISQTTKSILTIDNYDTNLQNSLSYRKFIDSKSDIADLNKYCTKTDMPLGKQTNIYFAGDINENKKYMDKLLEIFIRDLNINNEMKIVILSGIKYEDSFLHDYLSKSTNNQYFYKFNYNNKLYNIEFSTCRKFKGLEADAVILIDINEKFFRRPSPQYYAGEPNNLVLYVGASRAKHRLGIIIDADDAQCKKIAAKLPDSQITKPQKKIKNFLVAQ